MSPTLSTTLVRPPLVCWFVQEQFNWLGETRKRMTDKPRIQWRRAYRPASLSSLDARGSLVVLEYNGTELESWLADCHRLVDLGALVVAAATAPPVDCLVEMTMAGACRVLTNTLQCDRLERIIRKIWYQRLPRPVDWRAEIISRLPWPGETSLL